MTSSQWPASSVRSCRAVRRPATSATSLRADDVRRHQSGGRGRPGGRCPAGAAGWGRRSRSAPSSELLPRDPQDRLDRPVHVGLGGRPVRDRDPHQAAAVPGGAAHPAGAVALDRGDRSRSVRASSPKPTSTWLSTTSLAISQPAGGQPVGEPPRQRAAAVDQVGDARRGRAPGSPPTPRSRAPAATSSSTQVAHARGRRSGAHQVRRGVRRRGRRARRGGDTIANAASYGTFSHLWRVGAPRVGELDAVVRGAGTPGWRPPRGRTRRPRAPSRRRSCTSSQAARRSSQAPVFTLPDCRHTMTGPAGRRRAPRRSASTSMAPLASVSHELEAAVAEPEQPQRPVDRRVPLGVRDDPHPRRAVQAVARDVPARGGQHVVAAGGEPDRCSPPGCR